MHSSKVWRELTYRYHISQLNVECCALRAFAVISHHVLGFEVPMFKLLALRLPLEVVIRDVAVDGMSHQVDVRHVFEAEPFWEEFMFLLIVWFFISFIMFLLSFDGAQFVFLDKNVIYLDLMREKVIRFAKIYTCTCKVSRASALEFETFVYFLSWPHIYKTLNISGVLRQISFKFISKM